MQRTVLENVMFPLELIKASKKESITRATELIRLVGLSDKAKSYPCELSGGQKQRITIARALIRKPSILIFDEATSALDSISEYKVQQAITNSIKGRTTFIVAHRLSTIRNADRIVVMDEGRIVEQGTYEELMNNKSWFYKLKELNDINLNKSIEEI